MTYIEIVEALGKGLNVYWKNAGYKVSYAHNGLHITFLSNGYPHYYVAKDCGVICPDCVKDNLELIAEAMTEGWDDQWIVVACDINYEDDSLYCDNCNNRIISAYGDED